MAKRPCPKPGHFADLRSGGLIERDRTSPWLVWLQLAMIAALIVLAIAAGWRAFA